MTAPAPSGHAVQTAATAGASGPVPIAVVIPVHNGAAYLAEALASVQAQTMRAAEVIVVDDGSTDASGEIARRFSVQVLSRPRGGVAAARNAGIRLATSPWVAFLDADDVWDPSKLELQWLAVERSPGVGLVLTDFTEFDATGIVLPSFLARAVNYQGIERIAVASGVLRCDERSFRRHFLRGNFIAPSCVLARRDLLVSVGLFDEAMSYVEDRELWLRLLVTASVAIVERPVTHTRVHAANWSSNTLNMTMGVAMIADRVLAHPERYVEGALEHYRAERPRACLNVGRHAEEQGALSQARTFYLRSWRVGGGARPLVLALLCTLPTPVRRAIRSAARGVLGAVHRP